MKMAVCGNIITRGLRSLCLGQRIEQDTKGRGESTSLLKVRVIVQSALHSMEAGSSKPMTQEPGVLFWEFFL